MILILSTGISLWVVYGVLRSDRVIIGANAICLFFLANLLFLKLRENGAEKLKGAGAAATGS
jgi:MtN3 and saliva related transmembrane protein